MAFKLVDIPLGGLNLDNPPTTLNGDASDIANVRFDDSGAIGLPPVPVVLTTLSAANIAAYFIIRWHTFFYTSTTKKMLAFLFNEDTANTDSKFVFKTIPSTSETTITGFTTTKGINYLVYYLTLNSKILVCVSDPDKTLDCQTPMYWDGTSSTFTAITNIPKFRYPELHYEYIFGANTLANPSRLFWNTASDMTAGWDAATRYTDFDANDGDQLTAVKSFAGDLYVWKYAKCWKLVGNDFTPVTGNYSKILTSLPGCVNHKSIVIAEGYMYWMSPAGLVRYNGSELTYPAQGRLDDWFKSSLKTKGVFTKEDFSYVRCTYNPVSREIFVILEPIYKDGSTSYNWTSIFTYNLVVDKWSRIVMPDVTPGAAGLAPYTRTPIGCFDCDFDNTRGSQKIITISYGTKVYYFNNSLDDAYYPDPILKYTTQYYTTDILTFGDSFAYKTYGRLFVYAKELPATATPAQSYIVKFFNELGAQIYETYNVSAAITANNMQIVSMPVVPVKGLIIKLQEFSEVIMGALPSPDNTAAKTIQYIKLQLELEITDNGRT